MNRYLFYRFYRLNLSLICELYFVFYKRYIVACVVNDYI